eukprot:Tamp_36309.p1 GENE.Tamp_36309~~Tamp_36309.p1  ORF type:complete len:172 (+),score=4.69 Tamp_36309:74-517(+)
MQQSDCHCLVDVTCPASYVVPWYLCGLANCMCEPGREEKATSDGTSCEPCEPGQYKDTYGYACQDCPLGKFTTPDAIGTVACTPCSPGSYKATEGTGACTECPVDATSPPGSIGDFDCRCKVNCKSREGTLFLKRDTLYCACGSEDP